MARKRKLPAATPSSQPEPEAQRQRQPEPVTQNEPEDQSKPQPEPEPQLEPKREPVVQDDVEDDVQEQEEAEAEEDIKEQENPQSLDNSNLKEDNQSSEEESIDSDPESIKKVLDLFQKDKLIDILIETAKSHPDVLKQIHDIGNVDPSARKIFVHGLSWDTKSETLISFFTQYGEIEDCKAVVDKATGKSKGYAFILFKTRKGAQNALKEPQKKIGNRVASCQLASLGPAGTGVTAPLTAQSPVPEYNQKKIFVSNVGAEADLRKLVEFFGKFGEIEEGPLGLDKSTGKPRGFCLFVYKNAESANKALEEPHKNFEGQTLHCQKAVEGHKQQKPGFQTKGPKSNFGGGGHTMAPSASGFGYGPPQNPAVNQAALAALLAGQGVGGLANILGGPGMQGGYAGGFGGRGQGYSSMSGGPPYMGHR